MGRTFAVRPLYFRAVQIRVLYRLRAVPIHGAEHKAGSCILGYRLVGEIRRGDVLVFRHGGRMLVKRVAAVAGDAVYLDAAGNVHVNEELPYAVKSLTVPEGCFFMLGDNARESIDSRMWDQPFIKRGQVVAKLQ